MNEPGRTRRSGAEEPERAATRSGGRSARRGQAAGEARADAGARADAATRADAAGRADVGTRADAGGRALRRGAVSGAVPPRRSALRARSFLGTLKALDALSAAGAQVSVRVADIDSGEAVLVGDDHL
ncbi:MAG: hypothetical protein LBE44_13465, partial [Microbacterium hominis]|nr:hypothetical protein [Microbacterium hominis]